MRDLIRLTFLLSICAVWVCKCIVSVCKYNDLKLYMRSANAIKYLRNRKCFLCVLLLIYRNKRREVWEDDVRLGN